MQSEDRERPYRHIFAAISDGLILHDIETNLVIEANPAASAMHGYTHEEFIGLHPAIFMHPDSYTQFATWIQTVQAGHPVVATASHLRLDGAPFTVEVRGTSCWYQKRPCLLNVVRDVQARILAEQILQQQVEVHTREQTTLLEISQTLASALDLKPGLILDQLCMIIEYTHAVLFTLENLTLTPLAMRGSPQLTARMPSHIQLTGPDMLTALLNGHQPQRIANVWGDTPAAHFLRLLLGPQAHTLLAGIQAWMWVPLAVKGRVIGGIGVAHVQPDRFTLHHAHLALTVANQAAITLVNAQLYEQAQTLATLQERQRLAQSLHDAVNQSLFSASLIAEVLPRLWERNPMEGRRSLEDLRRLTRGAMAEMRGLLAELRPLVLTDTELGDLLRQLANALTGRTNIPVAVNVTADETLPADVQVVFYRLCQETLNNIAKHAQASQVLITLHSAAGAVELHIRDNGRGFDPDHTPSGHYGLRMMHERAEAVGATLSVTSQLGQGTEIVVHWTETEEK